ncbi:MAG: 50S ribosomal protein L11 [Sulfolobales archaeon]|nr:50S ribosomal protein L11 [Sulfolobales archaeon]MDW8010859.1 50S ribosomal protein L11 [Sulfolobales archaeon]
MQVKAGKATPSPPLGPTLSQYGLPVDRVVEEINRATEGYSGMDVTVVIRVDDSGRYYVDVQSPTTTSLLLNSAGVQESSGDPAHKKVGNVSLEDVIKVALVKKRDLNAKSLKAATKSVVSSARSIGLTVNGKDPREVLAEIDRGVYDDLFSRYEALWRGGSSASH